MNLYELDKAIQDFQFDEDTETGEILNIDELDNLQMERDHKIEQIALWQKDLLAESQALKNEIDNLNARKKATERKAESLKNYLNKILDGHKFKTSRVAISYRKSSKVDIYDDKAFIGWADKNDPNLITRIETIKPNKKTIAQSIKNGEQISGVRLVTSNNISIK